MGDGKEELRMGDWRRVVPFEIWRGFDESVSSVDGCWMKGAEEGSGAVRLSGIRSKL